MMFKARACGDAHGQDCLTGNRMIFKLDPAIEG